MDCDADVTLEVIDALMKHNACTRETVEALLKTPAIKSHVARFKESWTGWVSMFEQKSKRQKRSGAKNSTV